MDFKLIEEPQEVNCSSSVDDVAKRTGMIPVLFAGGEVVTLTGIL